AITRVEWDQRPLMIALVALLLAIVIYAREREGISHAGAIACVAALALIEAGLGGPLAMPETGVKDSRLALIRSHASLADFLHGQPGWFRVAVDPADVPYSFGDWYGVEQGDPARYFIGRKAPRPDMVALFEGANGVKVFLVPDAPPLVRVEHTC